MIIGHRIPISILIIFETDERKNFFLIYLKILNCYALDVRTKREKKSIFNFSLSNPIYLPLLFIFYREIFNIIEEFEKINFSFSVCILTKLAAVSF